MSAGKPAARRPTLGRGLSALLGEVSGDGRAGGGGRRFRQVPIEHLVPGRRQPRRDFDEAALRELAASIRANGLLQPIVAREAAPGRFEILAGERRWRAAQLAGLHDVPVLLREAGEQAALEIALVENLQRQDLNPLEEAGAYRQLIDEFGHTQEAVAEAVGKSRSHVANTVRLLGLPAAARERLRSGEISAGHARALLGAGDPDALLDTVLARGLSVRQTEDLARHRPEPPAADAPPADPAGRRRTADIRALERRLAGALGLRVRLRTDGSGQAGSLSLRYETLSQLDLIIARLAPPDGAPPAAAPKEAPVTARLGARLGSDRE